MNDTKNTTIRENAQVQISHKLFEPGPCYFEGCYRENLVNPAKQQAVQKVQQNFGSSRFAHDPSRKDNYPKSVGLAKFSEKHWDVFGRVQLIRQQRGPDGKDHFYRLDISNAVIRNKVRGITSNEELDRIFDSDAVRED